MQQIGDRAGVAVTLHNLASIDLNRGEYEEARNMFETALEINQQIGDRAGVAVTLHNLAAIDLNLDEYEEALNKFENALEINQQIGNRAGEAATFAQIGIMVAEEGHAEEGLRLVTLSAMILKEIGHADIDRVEAWIDDLALELEYTQEQFEAMLQEVAESYRRDRGRSLIDAAFGDT